MGVGAIQRVRLGISDACVNYIACSVVCTHHSPLFSLHCTSPKPPLPFNLRYWPPVAVAARNKEDAHVEGGVLHIPLTQGRRLLGVEVAVAKCSPASRTSEPSPLQIGSPTSTSDFASETGREQGTLPDTQGPVVTCRSVGLVHCGRMSLALRQYGTR